MDLDDDLAALAALVHRERDVAEEAEREHLEARVAQARDRSRAGRRRAAIGSARRMISVWVAVLPVISIASIRITGPNSLSSWSGSPARAHRTAALRRGPDRGAARPRLRASGCLGLRAGASRAGCATVGDCERASATGRPGHVLIALERSAPIPAGATVGPVRGPRSSSCARLRGCNDVRAFRGAWHGPRVGDGRVPGRGRGRCDRALAIDSSTRTACAAGSTVAARGRRPDRVARRRRGRRAGGHHVRRRAAARLPGVRADPRRRRRRARRDRALR